MTIRDLIRHMAYIGGVIHADEPETAVDSALLVARNTMRLMGSPTGFPTLRGVANVVFRGLSPLWEVVLAKRAPGETMPKFSYDVQGA